ncbi:DarT ssDNA thymidine ADP-ribosyltransferase family protein [Janthinobacterium sp. FW305-128]|uniref:DarT ssDNA thymidine ADP-ribosyltransferase family protein n=1 Tax=Janthinobacterium sp. FW305-128 TaxID=2775055 RepID=UPI001E4DAE04|nr:DarT ssDNA thymidine ADP-ribosyltransferase family protein [Janthinobacterium sp. FW305-128]MCC7680850.1 DUF4433 domain-containing protein [Janthinobacterium sp. FW305-128]
MNQAIKDSVDALKIPFLVHFTRAVNISSILVDGIIPRDQLHRINVEAQVNDENRYDNRRNGTCLSIAHPNALMFYKYRQENPGVAWTVLVLSKSLLWEKPCAFFKHNAATAEMRDTPLAALSNANALSGMYDDAEGDGSREEQEHLKSFDPTDKQAEVMVFGVIEPRYILGAAFQTQALLDQYRDAFAERKLYHHRGDTGLFASRSYRRKYQ